MRKRFTLKNTLWFEKHVQHLVRANQLCSNGHQGAWTASTNKKTRMDLELYSSTNNRPSKIFTKAAPYLLFPYIFQNRYCSVCLAQDLLAFMEVCQMLPLLSADVPVPTLPTFWPTAHFFFPLPPPFCFPCEIVGRGGSVEAFKWMGAPYQSSPWKRGLSTAWDKCFSWCHQNWDFSVKESNRTVWML